MLFFSCVFFYAAKLVMHTLLPILIPLLAYIFGEAMPGKSLLIALLIQGILLIT
jgi:hypothetical protein